MKILSVSNFFDTHGGGLERVAGHLCREFTKLGYEALWAACDGDGLPESPAEIIALRCTNSIEKSTGLPIPLPGLRSLTRLWKAVRRSDLVVIHDALYLSSIATMVMAKLAGKQTVLIQHIGSITFASTLLTVVMKIANTIVTKPMMHSASRVVFISATVREEFASVAAKREPLLVFNGVDTNVFLSHRDGNNSGATSQFGLPTSKPLAVFVGRLVEKKGLEIVRQLALIQPGWSFAIVGRGPIDPTKWQADNVFVLGQLSQTALARLYNASDVLLLPSVGEGYPLVIQEAMACGLPTVTGDVASRADPDATKWLTGVAIDLSDPTGSARRCGAAIDRVRECPPDRDEMSEYAKSTYSWQRMARAVASVTLSR